MSPLVQETNPLVGTHEPPTQEPFIGLLVRGDPPTYRAAILPGTHFAVFGTPENPDAAFRWVLVSISPNGKHIKGKCDCTVPGCTRTVEWKATYKGIHPRRER